MSLKKKTSDKFSFQSFIRLVIFAVVVYFLISYLSQNLPQKKSSADPTVLGAEDNPQLPLNQYINDFSQKAYQQLPQKSRTLIETLPSSPVIIQAQTKLDPQKIITEVKKMVVKTIYENIMKDLEKQK